jgi:hypothetical protein
LKITTTEHVVQEIIMASSSDDDEEWVRESTPPNAGSPRDGYLFAADSYNRRKRQELEEKERQRLLEEKREIQRRRDKLSSPALAPSAPPTISYPSPPPSNTLMAQMSTPPPVQFIPETQSATSAASTIWRAIWRKNSKVKTKLRIADTIMMNSEGQPSHWLFTSIKGTVLKKSKSNSTWESVYKSFEKKYNNQQRSIPKPNLSTPVARAWYRTSEIPRFLTMSDLSQLCEVESGESAVVQAHQLRGFRARSNVLRIQFHFIGRNGINVTYENTYTTTGVTGSMPVFATDRIKEEEENIENTMYGNSRQQKLINSTKTSSSYNGIKSISLQVNEVKSPSKKDENSGLLRVPSHDRQLNQRLNDMTKHLASMVEGRSRNTLSVRRLVVQYAVDPHGAAFFTDATELVVCPSRKTQKIDIPKAIRFPAPNRPQVLPGVRGDSGGTSTVDQRHVDFHRKSKRRSATTNASDMCEENGSGNRDGRVVIKEQKHQLSSSSVIAFGKARCNGDFCNFHEDMERQKSEIAAEVANKEHYVPWKAKDAKKDEWNKLQDDKQSGTGKDARVEEEEERIVDRRSLFRQQQHKTTFTLSTAKQLVLYRAIADARSTNLRCMPTDMLRWHVSGRAKRRRGAGPWLYVSIPERNMGSSLSYVPGQPVLTVWEWAGTIPYVRVQLFRGWDSACDVEIGTKNDGVLEWTMPSLDELIQSRREGQEDNGGDYKNEEDEDEKIKGKVRGGGLNDNDAMFGPGASQPRGPVWRLKISDTNNPQTFAYSGRFCVDFFSDSIEQQQHSNHRTQTLALKAEAKLVEELQIEEEEEDRKKSKLKGMGEYLSTLKEDMKIGPTLRYAQVHVCKGCYRVYCEIDRIKRDRERLVDAGCELDDLGAVISGVPPFDPTTDPYALSAKKNSTSRSNVLPAEEKKLAQSVAHMLDKDCDAGIAALLADADAGMADLLEDLDMIPKNLQKKRKENDSNNDDKRNPEKKENGQRRKAVAAPPGGNAKSRYARLMAKKEKRNKIISNLESITQKISMNLQRGLGVSGEMLDDLEAARRMGTKGNLLPPDNSALKKANALSKRLDRMPKTHVDGQGGHTGGTPSIAPSIAWSTSNPKGTGTAGTTAGGDITRESHPMFFDDEDYSDNSDDEEEPFLGSEPEGPIGFGGIAARISQPSLPNSHGFSGSHSLPALQDEQNVIAAAAAAMASIEARRQKHRAVLKSLRTPHIFSAGSLLMPGGGKKGHQRRNLLQSSSSEAKIDIDRAIIEHQARQSFLENGGGGAFQEERKNQKESNIRSPTKVRSPSPIRGRKKKMKKRGTSSPKRKPGGGGSNAYSQSSINRRGKAMGVTRASLPRTLQPIQRNGNKMQFMTKSESGSLFSEQRGSKFDEAMHELVIQENKELARQIMEKQRMLERNGGLSLKGKREKKQKKHQQRNRQGREVNSMTYNQVRKKMISGGSHGSSSDEHSAAELTDVMGGGENPEKSDELAARGRGRVKISTNRREKRTSPMRKNHLSPTNKKNKDIKKRSPKKKGSPKKKRRLPKKNRRSPKKKKSPTREEVISGNTGNGIKSYEGNLSLLLGDGGSMPIPLKHNAALRKVVCLLVLGQLSDIRSLLKIYQRNGVQGLAQRFQQRTPQTEQLNEEGTWVLENFVCVGQVFSNLWADRNGVDSGNHVSDIIPGMIRGADMDRNVPSTNPDVTRDACTLVRQFLRWFDISSGLARFHILSGIASWGGGRHEEAMDAWRAAALPPKTGDGGASNNAQLHRYDRAVACLLLGRHSNSEEPRRGGGHRQRNVGTPSSERLRWLTRARRGFLEVFGVDNNSEEAEQTMELVAVSREIDNTKRIGTPHGVLYEETDYEYSSSRPGTSMTNITNVSERGGRNGKVGRDNLASAASSAGSILGVSMEEEERELDAEASVQSLPNMDSVWSIEKPTTLGDAWKSRKNNRVRFSEDGNSTRGSAISEVEEQTVSGGRGGGGFRPQTTSRGSSRGVMTPKHNVDVHYDASTEMMAALPQRREMSMISPEGKRVSLMSAVNLPPPNQSSPSRSPMRRPPLASPKKTTRPPKHLRQGSAGVRRGSPNKSQRREEEKLEMESAEEEETTVGNKNIVVRRKSALLDELLAKEVEKASKKKQQNELNNHGSSRPSTDESVRFIQGMHAEADQNRRSLDLRLKSEKRRQLSTMQRKLSNVGDDVDGAATSPERLTRSLSKIDSLNVQQVQKETHSEVNELKKNLLNERQRQKEEMKRRLEARARQNDRKIRLMREATPDSAPDNGSSLGNDSDRRDSDRHESILLVDKAADAAYGFYQQQEIATQSSETVKMLNEEVAKEQRRSDREYLIQEADAHANRVLEQDHQRQQWMMAGGSAGSVGSLGSTTSSNHQHQQYHKPITPGSTYSDRSSLESRGVMIQDDGGSGDGGDGRYLEGSVSGGELSREGSREDSRNRYTNRQRFESTGSAGSGDSDRGGDSGGSMGRGDIYLDDPRNRTNRFDMSSRNGVSTAGSQESQTSFQRYYNVYTPMSTVSNADTDFDTWRNENFPSYTPSAGTMGRGLDSAAGYGGDNSHQGDSWDSIKSNKTLPTSSGVDFWKLQDADSRSGLESGGRVVSDSSGRNNPEDGTRWIYPLMGTLALPTGMIYRGNLLVAGDVLKIDITHDESDAYSFLAEGDNTPGHFALTVKGDEIVPLLTGAQLDLVREQRAGKTSGRQNINEESIRILISELAEMLDLISSGPNSVKRKLVLRAKDSNSSDVNKNDNTSGIAANSGSNVGGNSSGNNASNNGNSEEKNELSDMSGILHGLVNGGKSLALKAMLDAGASANAILQPSGSTLLIEAAKKGDIDCLHVLVSTGKVDINATDYEGNTALHYAQNNHDPDAALTASWLKAHGASSTKKNMYGLKPSDGRELERGGYYSNTF